MIQIINIIYSTYKKVSMYNEKRWFNIFNNRYFSKYRITNPDLLSNLFLPYVTNKNKNTTDDEEA